MRVIQIGLGQQGETWLKAVRASSEVTYAGFVEINPVVMASQAVKFDLDRSLIFTSLEEALQTVSAEAVIDVTPPRFHRSLASVALEAGLPVLAEKPLADTLADAEAIVRKSDETGVLYVVAQNYRYKAPIQTLKQVIDSGELGQVGSASVRFYRELHVEGFRAQMPQPLLVDMSIHHFDLMRFLFNSEPVYIVGRSWNPIWSWYQGDASTSVILEFGDGMFVSYVGSWCSLGSETTWNANWRVDCELGTIVLEDDEVYVQRAGRAPIPVESLPLKYSGQSYLLHELYRAVTQGTTPATTCQDNLKSLAIVFDTIKSIETGQPVRPIAETQRARP